MIKERESFVCEECGREFWKGMVAYWRYENEGACGPYKKMRVCSECWENF